MALCLCFAAVTVSAEIVWSSAFDFDGTPTNQTVEIDVDTPIVYSTLLRNTRQYNPKSITITATSKTNPLDIANIFYGDGITGELTGSEVWNFNDPKYDRFLKNDTYTLQERIDEIDDDNNPVQPTIYTRTITLAPEPSLIVALGLIGALLIRRRVKYVLAVLLLATIGSFNAWAGATVSSVTCQQAGPISRKVLITITFSSDSMYYANYYGTTDDGATTFDLRDRGTITGMSSFMGSGTVTVVWTPADNFDFKGKIKIGVELYNPWDDPDDISDASSATRYQYISSIPTGRWSDICKKAEETLKLVPAKTFTKKSSSEEDGTQHQVALRKSSNDGVFEVAQEQYL